MAAEKKSWVMYDSWIPLFEGLPKDKAADLIIAICKYRQDKTYVPEDQIVFAMFDMIRKTMDEDEQKYKKTCESRAESGKAGGEAKASKGKQNVANASKCQEDVANLADKDKEKDKELDLDKGLDKEKDSESSDDDTNARVARKDVQAVIDEWNNLPDPIPKVKNISKDSTRYNLIQKRIIDYGLGDVLNAIQEIRRSKFLTGGGDNGWHITFDWFIRPNNFPKVLEGNYRDAGQSQRKTVFDEWQEALEEVQRERAGCNESVDDDSGGISQFQGFGQDYRDQAVVGCVS